jgi:hypothetical protein
MLLASVANSRRRLRMNSRVGAAGNGGFAIDTHHNDGSGATQPYMVGRPVIGTATELAPLMKIELDRAPLRSAAPHPFLSFSAALGAK